jgi:hypothetical protein
VSARIHAVRGIGVDRRDPSAYGMSISISVDSAWGLDYTQSFLDASEQGMGMFTVTVRGRGQVALTTGAVPA